MATQDKIASVKLNVKIVLDVITAEKEKQLKYEQTKTEFAIEGKIQQGINSSHLAHHSWGDDGEEDVTATGAPSTRRGDAASHNHRRLMFKSAGRPQPPMMMACAAPENNMTEYHVSSETMSSQQEPIYNDKVLSEQRMIHEQQVRRKICLVKLKVCLLIKDWTLLSYHKFWIRQLTRMHKAVRYV